MDKPEPLEANIRRVREAIARGEAPQSQLVSTMVTAVAQHALDRASVKIERKLARHREREERRRLRRERRAKFGRPQAAIQGAIALVLVGLAVMNPHLWWLVFIALGLGTGAVTAFAQAARAPQLDAGERQAPPPVQAQVDPAVAAIDARLARLDTVSTQIVSELKTSPQAVRDFVQQPVETVQALQAAGRELARRERELRALLPAGDDQRLEAERAALALRIGGEADAVVRGRLQGALEALDSQRAQRRELATAAARFEAEGTRLVYTLENLRTQVLRARSAESASPDVLGAGLQQSLTQVSLELGAIAEALETVHAPQAPVDLAIGGSEAVATAGKVKA